MFNPVLTEVLYFDWNDFIQDQNKRIRELIFDLTDIALSLNDFNEWDSPKVAKIIGWTVAEWNSFAWNNSEIQATAKPFPYVKKVLDRLMSNGHNVKILTASPLGCEFVETWFDKFDVPFSEIICNGNKAELIGQNALGDDNPQTIADCIKNGQNIIRLARPWNMNMGLSCPTFYGWQEWSASCRF